MIKNCRRYFNSAAFAYENEVIKASPTASDAVRHTAPCRESLLNTLNNKSACAATVITGRTKAAILNHILFISSNPDKSSMIYVISSIKSALLCIHTMHGNTKNITHATLNNLYLPILRKYKPAGKAAMGNSKNRKTIKSSISGELKEKTSLRIS